MESLVFDINKFTPEEVKDFSELDFSNLHSSLTSFANIKVEQIEQSDES